MATQQESLPPCVLVTTGGAWGSLLGMVRSIGSRGVRVFAVRMGGELNVLARSRYCAGVASVPFDGSDDDLVQQFLGWVHGSGLESRPLVLPMSDNVCTCMAERRHLLEDRVNLGIARTEAIVAMANKKSANAWAEANGLCTPQTGFASSMETLRQVAETMRFPVIVKPTWWRERGRSQFKVERCESKTNLLEAGAKFIDQGANLVIQQYIPGGDEAVEVYMFYRSRDGRTIQECTGLKLRQSSPGAGIMASGRAVWLPEVARMSEKFLNGIDYCGLGGIEYKRYEGRHYFIEVSVRSEGFHPLAIEAGVDLPWLAYLDLALDRMPREQVRQTREAYWCDGTQYLNPVVWRTSPGRALWELVRFVFSWKTRFALWSWKDPMPWLAFVVRKACRLGARVWRGRIQHR